jgi:hypothetical protein
VQTANAVAGLPSEQACHLRISVEEFLAANYRRKQPRSSREEVFESIYNSGKLLLLVSWRDGAAAEHWKPRTMAEGILRHRRVRVIRDYGMFDRREAPQFYPEVKMTVQKRERATIVGQQSVVSDTPIVIEAGFAASLIRARPSECSKLLRLPPPTQTACKRGAS